MSIINFPKTFSDIDPQKVLDAVKAAEPENVLIITFGGGSEPDFYSSTGDSFQHIRVMEILKTKIINGDFEESNG